jgi:hypothetical protein
MLTITERCWHTYRQEALIEKSPHIYCNHFIVFQWSNWCLCFGWFGVLLFAVAEWLCENKRCDFGGRGCSPKKKSRISTQYILRISCDNPASGSTLWEELQQSFARECRMAYCFGGFEDIVSRKKSANNLIAGVWMLRSALPKVHGSNSVHWMVVLNRLVRSRQPFRGTTKTMVFCCRGSVPGTIQAHA